MERRTFLALGAAAAAIGLAGCTQDPSEPGPASGSPAVSDPDARLRDDVAASELALIASYRSAIRENPELAGDLEPFLTHHQLHLARVAPAMGADASAGSASADPGSSSEPVADVLRALGAAESRAQAERATACDGAQDPALARDLCLIAASEAQHAAALGELAARDDAS